MLIEIIKNKSYNIAINKVKQKYKNQIFKLRKVLI